MIDEASSIEYLRTRETAAEYRRGYDVALEAPLDSLPGFYADLVVGKDDEVKVIEVKSRSSLAAEPRILASRAVAKAGVTGAAGSAVTNTSRPRPAVPPTHTVETISA